MHESTKLCEGKINMQLIDKDGKIFGKVNILDLAVLLLVLLVVFAVAINKFFPNRVPRAIRPP